MKHLIAYLAFIMMSQANAQAPAQVQVQAAPQAAPIVAQAAPAAPKKTLIYDERTNQLVEVAPQVQAEATANAPAASPIYILNNQKLQGYQGTSAVQDAPTTVVQEAPVKVSASETIRKERQGAEAATEDGIVQTLEKARLEDEVRRREKFNAALAPAPAAPAQAAVAQAQAVVVAPQAPQAAEEIVEAPAPAPQKASKRKKVVLEDATEDKVDVKAEIRAAIAEQNAAPANLTSYYVAGQVGAASYESANIRSKLASGFSIGMVTPERFVFEGSFMYGQSEIDNIAGFNADGLTYDISQYNFSAAAKYQLLPGKLRPTVGGIASYTRRNYSMSNSYGGCYNCYYGGSSNQDKGSTDAFDAGLEAGIDLALTNSFSIGADFRYFWNIASKTSNENGYRTYSYNNQRYMNGGIPVVEDLSYYIATLSAKFTF